MMLGETYWIVNAKGDGWICGFRWRECEAAMMDQNPVYSTGQPRDPDGMRGHAWGPERDDLIAQTCTARLGHVFVPAWWWRRRWACALNTYGKRCDTRSSCRWLTLSQCIVETCRPGMRETSLDSASCLV